jgi:hypothetical protein
MGWIRDKLSLLIEEGKKALKCDIVIMSDAKEDICINIYSDSCLTVAEGLIARTYLHWNGLCLEGYGVEGYEEKEYCTIQWISRSRG